MELRFVAPHLRYLDTVGSEVLACGLFSDERPLQGVAGLVDWRTACSLTRYLEIGELTGELGETVLIPGKPRIPFEKLLLFGLGPKQSFSEEVYGSAIEQMLRTLSGLKVRMAVVERPGRHLKSLGITRSLEILLEACTSYQDQDLWTLVEEPLDQKTMAQRLAEERHRKRLR